MLFKDDLVLILSKHTNPIYISIIALGPMILGPILLSQPTYKKTSTLKRKIASLKSYYKFLEEEN